MSVLIGFAIVALALSALAVFSHLYARRVEARYPPVGDFVVVGGGSIHVVDHRAEGRERGTVLLLHGASANFADMSVALAAPLNARGFRVLSFDRLGAGWSDRLFGRGASSPLRQADALVRAARRKGVESAVIVAHSYGGAVALAMAIAAPEFARALTLIAPASHPWPGGVAWYYHLGAHPLLGAFFRRLVVAPLGAARMRQSVAGVFAPNPPPADFADKTRIPLVLRPRNFRAYCEDVIDLHAAVSALSPRYREIRTPVEIVAGDRDTVVSPAIHAEALKREIAGARLTILRGIGHSPHHAATDRVVEAILAAADRGAANGSRRLESNSPSGSRAL